MAPLSGGRYCFNHEPGRAKDRATARRRGGRQSRRNVGKAAVPAPVGSVGALQEVLGRAIADVELLPNSAQRGRTLASLVHTGLRALEAGSIEERLAALEQLVGGATGVPR